MKHIKLPQARLTVAGLIRSAKRESVVLVTATGQRLILTSADDFATEVELLRKHHKLLTFLDARSKEPAMVSLNNARRRP